MGNRNPGEKMIADLLRNPLTRGRDENDRARVVSHFTALSDSPQTDYLVLRRYLDVRPEKFYDKNSYDTYLRWLWERDSAMPEQTPGASYRIRRCHWPGTAFTEGNQFRGMARRCADGWRRLRVEPDDRPTCPSCLSAFNRGSIDSAAPANRVFLTNQSPEGHGRARCVADR